MSSPAWAPCTTAYSLQTARGTPFGQVPGTAGQDVQEIAIARAPDNHMHIVATVGNGTPGSGNFDVKHTVRWASGSGWDSFATVGSMSRAARRTR